MVIAPGSSSLGMKADKGQRRSGFSRGEILLVRAVLQKLAQKVGGFWRSGTCRIRSADPSARQRSQNRGSSKIVQVEIFFGSSFPIVDVRLIPDFPKPGLGFGFAVAVAQVSGKVKHKVRPLLIILRRVGPAGENRTLRKTVAIRLRM